MDLPPTEEAVYVAPVPSRADRLALRILQLGAIGVVLAASTYRQFDLDRFLIPKEIVLHVTAFLAGLLTVRRFFRRPYSRSDLFLLGYVLLSAASALFATNHWVAGRALAVSISSVVLFCVARHLREAGLGESLLVALAYAVVIASATSLLQAYGVRLDVFSLNRAPGGTLGNRNFVAHAAAFGFPLIVWTALRARRAGGFLMASIGVAVVAMSLVLSRSRAAWLAFAAAMFVFLLGLVFARALRRSGRTWGRLLVVALFIAGAVAAALLIPNTLRWVSDNPYLESVKDVANYQEGSGRGRLIQYGRSMRMTVFHPLLGVGPGNWSVRYPEYAPASDPSMNTSEGGVTFNPWPSSDWIAFVSERGFAAAALLAAFVVLLLLRGVRSVFDAVDADAALLALVFLCTLIAAGVAGAFDAVLLLGLPALIIWTAVGASWPGTTVEAVSTSRSNATLVALLLVIASGLGAARSIAQLVAIDIYTTGGSRTALERASVIDPGNYRLQMRLARSGKRNQRCPHAAAAHALYPNADAARAANRACGH